MGICQVVLAGLQRPPGLLDRLLLDLDQQLDLEDLVVAGLRQVDAFGRLLFRPLRGLQCFPGDVDLSQVGHCLCLTRLGQLDLSHGRVARLRHLLLLPQWAGPRLLEPGEACILQFGQRQRGPRRLDSGAGLVDALVDLVAGQLQRFLSLGSVGLGGGERPAGDLDLDRHLLADPVQVGTLADQLGLRRVELGPRHIDFVAVRDRIDLREHLPFLDAIILLDQKPDDPAGDQLRGDVDDVGLDKGVVGDRVRTPVANPVHRKRHADGEERDQQNDREDKSGAKPIAATSGLSRRGRGLGFDILACRRLRRLGCTHGLLRMLQLLRRLMMPGDLSPRRLANPHRIFQAGRRDQVIVPSIQVILLGTGQRGLRVGNLRGRGRTLAESQSHEPVILGRLLHSRAHVIDADPGRDGIPVGLVDLKRNIIGDRLGLGHGLAYRRVRHAGRGDLPAALEERPLEPDEPESQICVGNRVPAWKFSKAPFATAFGAKSARATRVPSTAICTVRRTTSNSRRSRMAVCKQSQSDVASGGTSVGSATRTG